MADASNEDFDIVGSQIKRALIPVRTPEREGEPVI